MPFIAGNVYVSQTVGSAISVISGVKLTVKSTLPVPWQPLTSVTLTVYVIVPDKIGVAVGVAIFVADKPLPLVQFQELALFTFASKFTVSPKQIGFGLTVGLTVIAAPTEKVIVAIAPQSTYA